jgi:hypothetical protein
MMSPHCVCVCVCVCVYSLYCLNQLMDFYEISYECRSLECYTFKFLQPVTWRTLMERTLGIWNEVRLHNFGKYTALFGGGVSSKDM